MASRTAQPLGGVIRSVQYYGLLAAAGYVLDHIRVHRAERAEGFDERYGTMTGGKVYPWQLSDLNGAEAANDVYPYEATPAWLIRKIIHSLPITLADFVFVDIGSGKGKALLVASEFGFSKIVGIEISQELSDIAVANLGRRTNGVATHGSYDLRCMNATQYGFENEPLVVFLFNPFGKDTFDRVISRLEESLRRRPREVYVAYLNPRFESRLKRSPVFARLRADGSRLRPWRRYVVYRSQDVQ